MNNKNNKSVIKGKKYPLEKVFIVNESFAGKKEFGELFAELLCAEYFRQEPACLNGAAQELFNGK